MRTILTLLFVILSFISNSQVLKTEKSKHKMHFSYIRLVNHNNNKQIKMNAKKSDFFDWLGSEKFTETDNSKDKLWDPEFSGRYDILTESNMTFNLAEDRDLLNTSIPASDKKNFWGSNHEYLSKTISFKYKDKLRIRLLMKYKDVKSLLDKNNIEYIEKESLDKKNGLIKTIVIPLACIDDSVGFIFSKNTLMRIVC